MDANGTRYWTLLGRDDWGACTRVADLRGETDAAAAAEPPGAGEPLARFWAGRESAATLAVRGWDDLRQALMLPQLAFRFPAAPGDQPPDVASRRGAAGDRHGHIYWIDRDGGRILRQCAGDARTEAFWPPQPATLWRVGEDLFASRQPAPPGGPGQPDFGLGATAAEPQAPRLAGLAVTPDQRLLAGSICPAGLLEFDLESNGPPRFHPWPEPPAGVRPFEPYDIGSSSDCVWVLDRPFPGSGASAVPVAARLWKLDARLRCADPLPLPVAPPPAGAFHGEGLPAVAAAPRAAAIDFDRARPLSARDPVALEALDDGTALLLDNPLAGEAAATGRWSRLLRIPAGVAGEIRALPLEALLEAVEADRHAAFSLRGHAMIVLPPETGDGSHCRARVFVVAQDGNQAFVFLLLQDAAGERLQALPAFYPMRLYRGRGLAAAAGRPFYDSRETWVPLVPQARPRHAERMTLLTWGGASGAAPGERPPLDGGVAGCVWHRVMIDGDLPPGTALRLWSRCSDSPGQLAATPWREQPQPRLRDTELPWLAKGRRDTGAPGGCGSEAARDVAWQRFDTRDLLLQQACGRYLQLRLELSGNGLATPRLQSMRVWFPRFGYSRYLPACWREDPQAADFLDRLLAIAEGAFTSWEDRIATLQMLFDARSAPREHLDWLAGWLGLALDPQLDEGRRRLMLRHGHRLLRERGTLPGLQRLLRLVFDPCSGDELFTMPGPLPERPGDIRIVERPERSAHRLTLRLPTRRGDTTLAARRLRAEALLRSALPAHVAWNVDSYDTAFRLGSARVGFETLLGGQEAIAAAVVDHARLGQARLAAPPDLPRSTLDRDRIGGLPPLT